MKEINREVQPSTNRGRTQLMIVAIVVCLISLAMFVGGIVLIVNGCMTSGVWSIIWRVALGILLVVFGGIFGWVAIMMLATAFTMIKNGQGSVADATNTAVGTVGVTKCEKCGTQLDEKDGFCPKCGKSSAQHVNCPKCGAVNKASDEFCTKCGGVLDTRK